MYFNTVTHNQILLLDPMAWLSLWTSLLEPVHNLVLVNSERFCLCVTLCIKVFGLCHSSHTFSKTQYFGNCSSLPQGKVVIFQRLLSRAFVTYFFSLQLYSGTFSETLHCVEKIRRVTSSRNPLVLILSSIFNRAALARTTWFVQS